MRRILHLQQHHHTGKKLTHKHTSYRGLFVLIALFGIALLMMHRSVNADTIVATAKIAAPTPASAAVIGNPIDGSTSSTDTVTVTGSCAYVSPASVVEIYIDTVFAGSSTCPSNGTFSVPITLNLGLNHLIARTVNITDDYGPDSIQTAVTYEPPAPIQPSTPRDTGSVQPATGEQVGTGSPIIRSEHTYILYSPSKDAEWAGYFEGGSSPYRVTIDWGDGTSSNYTNVSTDPQKFRHTYSTYTTYFITVTVTDQAGNTSTSQLAAVTSYVSPVSTPATITTEEMVRIDKIIVYIGYGTVIALTMLGVVIVLHGQSNYVLARPVAKQYIRTRNHTRTKGGHR